MNHLSEEELILHYYGEEGDSPEAALHLDECAECRALYGSLQRVLNVVDTLPVPEMAPEPGGADGLAVGDPPVDQPEPGIADGLVVGDVPVGAGHARPGASPEEQEN